LFFFSEYFVSFIYHHSSTYSKNEIKLEKGKSLQHSRFFSLLSSARNYMSCCASKETNIMVDTRYEVYHFFR
jgi:hypothetical protein